MNLFFIHRFEASTKGQQLSMKYDRRDGKKTYLKAYFLLLSFTFDCDTRNASGIECH